MKEKIKILVAEDNKNDLKLLENEFRKDKLNYELKHVQTEHDFRKGIKTFNPDLIISDYSMPVFDGMMALRIKQEMLPDIPFIIVTGSINEETAVKCMKAGADDYVLKERISQINKSIHAALKSYEMSAEKKNADEEIEKLSRALEQSPASVVITNLDGNIEYINPKFTETTGYAPAEVIGKNPRFLKSPISIGIDYSNLWETITAGREWKGEFFNRKKNDEHYWVSVSISAIRNLKGDITHYLAVEEDITEKKAKEQELIEAKNKAEEMNRLKSYFLANMSHELRTPMVSILGFSEILLDLTSDPETRNYAEMIHKGATRLMDTLNLILNLSLIEAETLELSKARMDVVSELNEIVKSFFPVAEKKNLYLSFEKDCESLLIHTDKRILKEALSNLINNAVKFTDEGCVSINLSTKDVKDKDFAEIRIKDTGIGINKETREIIWQEYRQASEGYSRSFEGTGLGLTVSKNFINKIGGDVIIEDSEPGKGTTFLITLPLQEDGSELPETIPAATESVEKKEVHALKEIYDLLYVDDDEMAVSLLKLYLKDFYNLDTADNGNECLNKARLKKYAAVLVDINLGTGADGLETALELKKIHGYENTPVIAITAFAMEGDREEFLHKGCTHYISKPFKRSDLISLINEAVVGASGK